MDYPQSSNPTKHVDSSCELWVDGLLCAYEFIPGPKKHIKVSGKLDKLDTGGLFQGSCDADLAVKGELRLHKSPAEEKPPDPSREPPPRRNLKTSQHWVPIGWTRLEELVRSVQMDADWVSADESDYGDYDLLSSVADVAAPYWEPKSGPTWWCNVLAGHLRVDAWLSQSQKWLHPAVSLALKDESKLISERMKHLYYEVPVRVAGGLLFELLGQSIGDPHHGEGDVPIVLRSWQAQKFLLTALHVKGTVKPLNVLGILEVQDLIGAGGAESPKSVQEVIAHLANRLARWDDRLFRKTIFGAADEVELKFVNRRENEDLTLLTIILNQEIKRLSTQIIRVKWQLHAREEILFELANHLKGSSTHELLATIRQGTREMIAEQEAVRDRIFTVQDAVHNTVRSVLQDKSVRITHNLAVFGGCGLILSIITGLFGINVDGIPGGSNYPNAFFLFSICFFTLGLILVGLGFLYLGLKKPISEDQLLKRKRELQLLVKSFQHAAETHANFRYIGSGSYSLPIDEKDDDRMLPYDNNGYFRIVDS